ncbi:DNA glycosylase AlkZ-like family protein [Cellulomonas algicola]|uniref:DNA glycosylase AlkZ-like family protein n=1 Tax=Cellulomonas algicola TaxID=2071633 RepID=UPI00190F441A|nr:crosslink repair DNA glycosylase YcaQ family protein [Cellulomonas algicola]
MGVLSVSRDQVLRYRLHVQQLDRPVDPARAVTDAAVLDLGAQDTGPDGALWALAARGVPVQARAWPQDDLALVWSLRGAPHAYRRDALRDVQAALRPFSDADAGARVYDAAKPLRAAGIRPVDGLTHAARTMRTVVTEPTVKGALSTRMTQELPEPYVRWCRACRATHMWEMTFRLAALHGGLELEPGTSPPVVRRIPGWPASRVGSVERRRSARPDVLDPVRLLLHLLGPLDPKHVAVFLDAPVADVRERWPSDAVDVEVDGAPRSVLAADVDALADAGARDEPPVVRLLGPYDLFLQSRDRETLVPDASRRRTLWPVLGRPGAVLVDGDVVGTWRPRAKGRRLGLELDPWLPWSRDVERAVDVEHERLAEFRGLERA